MLPLMMAAALAMQAPGQDAATRPAQAASAVPSAPAIPPANESQAASAPAARAWLALVDAGNWDESWRGAGTLFRTRLDQTGWASMIAPVRQPLGGVIARQYSDVAAFTKLPDAPDGRYEIVRFTTDFHAKADALETVVMMKEQADWKVVGYFIR